LEKWRFLSFVQFVCNIFCLCNKVGYLSDKIFTVEITELVCYYWKEWHICALTARKCPAYLWNQLKLAYVAECDKWIPFKTQVTFTPNISDEKQPRCPFASFPFNSRVQGIFEALTTCLWLRHAVVWSLGNASLLLGYLGSWLLILRKIFNPIF